MICSMDVFIRFDGTRQVNDHTVNCKWVKAQPGFAIDDIVNVPQHDISCPMKGLRTSIRMKNIIDYNPHLDTWNLCANFCTDKLDVVGWVWFDETARFEHTMKCFCVRSIKKTKNRNAIMGSIDNCPE